MLEVPIDAVVVLAGKLVAPVLPERPQSADASLEEEDIQRENGADVVRETVGACLGA